MTDRLEIMSSSIDETQILGKQLGKLLRAGDVICLSGDLGAGKTTFSVGVGQGWGSEQALTSPTFVIVHRHERPADNQILHHLDAYRLASSEDAESIAFDDMIASNGVMLIEWAEHIRDALPDDYLWVTLDYSDDDTSRFLTFEANGQHSREILRQISETIQ